jgi:hypothetical protein
VQAEKSPKAGDVAALSGGQATLAMLELAKEEIDMGAPALGTGGLARSFSAERGHGLVRPITVMLRPLHASSMRRRNSSARAMEFDSTFRDYSETQALAITVFSQSLCS